MDKQGMEGMQEVRPHVGDLRDAACSLLSESSHFDLSPHLKFHLELCPCKRQRSNENQERGSRNLLETSPEERGMQFILG